MNSFAKFHKMERSETLIYYGLSLDWLVREKSAYDLSKYEQKEKQMQLIY